MFNTKKLWPISSSGKAEIEVCVLDESSTYQPAPWWSLPIPSIDSAIGAVRHALEVSWERAGSVEFTGFDWCSNYSADERENMVGLYIHPEAGNSSYLGTDARGKTSISNPGIQFKPWGNDFNSCIQWDWPSFAYKYKWQCLNQYAVHEFGHLIGAEHEWVHPEVPSSCPQADPISSSNSTYLVVNEDYDYDSIMTYWEGCVDQTGVRFGSRNLSYWDRVGVRSAYPEP